MPSKSEHRAPKARTMILLVASLIAVGQARAADEFYRRYVGVLGEKTRIVIHLTVTPRSESGDNVTGYCYYAKYRRPIALAGVFEDGRFTLSEGEERSANHLRLTLQGDGLAGEWTSKDGATSHPVAATESYDGAVAFDVLSVEETRALDSSLPDGPGAGFSLQWLIPRQTAEGERLDAVRQFAMNCVQRPKTSTADEGASAAGGEPPCETSPVQATPEELARTAAEDYFRDYVQTNAGLVTDLCEGRPLKECLDDGMAGGLGWESSESTRVVFNDDGLLVLASDYGGYSGGAHGYYGTTLRTFDLAAGRMVRARDLFEAGSETRIVAMLEQAFRDSRGPAANADVKEALLVESIPLTDNFGVNGNGITFVYVPYEIASYADGQIELTLPWRSLMVHLRAGTAAARLAR